MKNIFKSYRDNNSGQIAIMFGLCFTLLLAGVGVTLDMSSLSRAKQNLQDAVDAAVLAAAREDGNNGDKKKAGEAVFLENLSISSEFSPKVKFKFLESNRVRAEASSSHRYHIMSMLGASKPKLSAVAEATTKSYSNVEIVLVLDYSSSMNDQYEEMRDGAIALIDNITAKGASKDVKIGLVPFAEHVYFDLDGEYIQGGTPGVMWSNCTSDRGWPFVTTDSTITSNPDSQWGVIRDVDDDDDYAPILQSWSECDAYRDDNLFVRPLTVDHKGTMDSLEVMEPHAGTNLALGMEIGWQVISPNAPWTEGASYGDNGTKKFIIMLGDGAHSKGGSGSGGKFTDSQGRDNFDQVCDNAKAKNISIISIAYDVEDSGARDRLKACASKPEYFFEGDKTTIGEVFSNIGDGVLMSDLRLIR